MDFRFGWYKILSLCTVYYSVGMKIETDIENPCLAASLAISFHPKACHCVRDSSSLLTKHPTHLTLHDPHQLTSPVKLNEFGGEALVFGPLRWSYVGDHDFSAPLN